jgi:hypothetical protein
MFIAERQNVGPHGQSLAFRPQTAACNPPLTRKDRTQQHPYPN